jgi:hypothetical protein
MISLEVTKNDLREAMTEVRNLPGTLFAGTGPLLRPFLTKLEPLLPPQERGLGKSYIFASLRTHVDTVYADSEKIKIESAGKGIEITKNELESILGDKYPSFQHEKLNLPGLLFLQSGPALQMCTLDKLNREHDANIPEGRRALRYVFHTTVASIDANKERIKIEFDLDRLPKRKGPSASIEASD